MFRTETSESMLYEPMYSAAEVGRLVDLSSVRVRRWISGYSYDYGDIRRRQPPIIRHPDSSRTSFASFLDLIDLLFVKKFLEHGISLQKLRKALDEASNILQTDHFARSIFFTDGRNVYLQVKKEGDAILHLLAGGQWVISDVIRNLAHQIEFDTLAGLACRWFPLGPNGLVVLDPLVSFGRPHILMKGVATSNVYDFFVAEGKKIRPVCRWLDLTQSEVEAAILFEERLVA